jgi:hypothetical protein
MFTYEELELMDAALTLYWLHNREEYERQEAKGRKKCGWHLSVMNRIDDLHTKIFMIKNSILSLKGEF